jgi:phosphate starvation-inducible PhoH-like protein
MKAVIPKSPGQIKYLNALKNYLKPVVIVSGPAGSGKTLFACQEGVEKLYRRQVDRLVLTRPIVTVDEDLGYLPGTVEAKMDPWTRPMFDIMDGYFSSARIKKMVSDKVIEVSPLAYMRGRTFDNCFVVADEMQNSTQNQMKTILTRLGEDSKMVITGDVDQCDLPSGVGGLSDILFRMDEKELEYIEKVILEGEDIHRHPAVKEVLHLYL